MLQEAIYIINRKREKIHPFFRALIMNIIILFILLLFFEPTAKSDDYDITNLLYGGYNGEYSPFILYINVILGYLLKGFLILFPCVSWYYILGFIGLLLSFALISYVVEKIGLLGRYKSIYFFLLLFSGYEFYIRTTFTKTSGVMITAGMIFILYLINENINFDIQYLIGIIFVVIGALIRGAVFYMLTLFSFSCFIIFCVENKKNVEKLKKGVFRFIIIICLLYFIVWITNLIHTQIYKNDETWNEYLNYNRTRASLLDYTWPDYYEFQEKYEKLGVSENDYNMWARYANIADPEMFTTELMEEIRKIDSVNSDKSIKEIFLEMSKKLLMYFKGNLMFYLSIACGLILCFEKRKKGVWKFILIFIFFIGIYYYLSYKGRLRHHVDAVLFFMGSILMLYYCNGYEKICEKEKRRTICTFISLIILSALLMFYNELISSSYYGTAYGIIKSQKEKNKENYDRLSQLSFDKKNLYLIGTNETNNIYQCFNVFQVFEKGFYSNIYRMNDYSMFIPRQILKNFDVLNDNPLSEITDNDKIFYCVYKTRKEEIDVVTQYIREHYNEKAEARLVKNINGLYVYRFVSG
jgi:ABC-type multidrug transport system fused ATPase/permease subunit